MKSPFKNIKRALDDDVSFGELGFVAKIKKHLFSERNIFDPIVLLLVLILFLIGFSMVCSVESVRLGSKEMALQLGYGIVGIFLMIVIALADYRVLNNYLSILFFIVIFGVNAFYALLALKSGGIVRGTHFQASEVLKFAVVVLLAYLVCGFAPLFSKKKKSVTYGSKTIEMKPHVETNRWQFKSEKMFFLLFKSPVSSTLLMLAVVIFSAVTVVLQSHLSGGIIVLLIGYIILLAGGADKRILIPLGILGIAVVVLVAVKPEIVLHIKGLKNYMYERIALWKYKYTVTECKQLGFDTDRTQVEASLKAIGSGGLFGLGYNNSIQKYSYLAFAKTDFILAIVVEELGYLRTLLIFALYALLVLRCVKIATSVNDKFGALIVCGVTFQIALELLLNIAVVTDMMPNTGITLPFFSYGGSALIMLFIEMGFVLSVSKHSAYTIRRNKAMAERLKAFNKWGRKAKTEKK